MRREHQWFQVGLHNPGPDQSGCQQNFENLHFSQTQNSFDSIRQEFWLRGAGRLSLGFELVVQFLVPSFAVFSGTKSSRILD